MPASEREHILTEFRDASRAVISNAKCLTEGVDVPAVDMVAFLAPRCSRVDIVQATGRAMRKAPGKTTGYVLVPLFVEQAKGETIEEALARTDFDEIWSVLQAMQEQDDLLAEIIRQMREEQGRTPLQVFGSLHSVKRKKLARSVRIVPCASSASVSRGASAAIHGTRCMPP